MVDKRQIRKSIGLIKIGVKKITDNHRGRAGGGLADVIIQHLNKQ